LTQSIEEMTAWTTEELLEEVLRVTPEGLTFKYDRKDGWFIAQVTNSDAEVLWSDSHADPRILFFNAFGWLKLRHHKPQNPAWTPRTREVNPAAYVPRASTPSANVPDPPDLDPTEVSSVYTQRRGR
jgi:hypothetical protein